MDNGLIFDECEVVTHRFGMNSEGTNEKIEKSNATPFIRKSPH